MNYYERHIGDWIKDTVKLSMLEDGAYNRLVDQCYQTEKPLPLDVRDIYREARAATPAERKAVDYVLKTFFDQSDEGFTQKRVTGEIARYQAKKQKARDSANARWNKDETHIGNDANALRTDSEGMMRTHSERNAHQSPVTSHQSPSLEDQDADASLSTSAKPTIAELQKVIDGIPSGLKKLKVLPCPHVKLLEWWATDMKDQLQHTSWDGARLTHMKARWRETAVAKGWKHEDEGIMYFRKLFRYMRSSDFLMGKVPPRPGFRQFELKLSWVVNAANWAKIHDGEYHNKTQE